MIQADRVDASGEDRNAPAPDWGWVVQPMGGLIRSW